MRCTRLGSWQLTGARGGQWLGRSSLRLFHLFGCQHSQVSVSWGKFYACSRLSSFHCAMVKVKALHKVQKQITKKRGHKSNSLHENSRDSQRLRTAGAREDKLAKLLVAATKANRTYGQIASSSAQAQVADRCTTLHSRANCVFSICTSRSE